MLSGPGSSWNTGKILPQFERPAIVVKGVRMDDSDHDGNVRHSFDCVTRTWTSRRRLSVNIHDAGRQNAFKAPDEGSIRERRKMKHGIGTTVSSRIFFWDPGTTTAVYSTRGGWCGENWELKVLNTRETAYARPTGTRTKIIGRASG